MAKSKINKQREIEQRRRKKRKRILIILLIMIIIAILGTYLLTSEVFNIKQIAIEGNKQLSQEQIYEIANIKQGDNIFAKIGIIAKVKLKENGYIEEAKIKKIYPNKIKIEIKEREKEYQILTESGTYIYIDGQGYIIDYSIEELELITITGMETTENNIEKIKRLNEEDLDKMEKILYIKQEIENNEIENQIQKIDTKNEYILHTDNENIIINLGDATNIKNKMMYVKAILKEEKGNSGTINVSGNINEGFSPYFSPK